MGFIINNLWGKVQVYAGDLFSRNCMIDIDIGRDTTAIQMSDVGVFLVHHPLLYKGDKVVWYYQ